MNMTPELEALRQRNAPLDMLPGEFREIGHRLVTQRWRLVAWSPTVRGVSRGSFPPATRQNSPNGLGDDSSVCSPRWHRLSPARGWQKVLPQVGSSPTAVRPYEEN